ncbi:hypothetical protein G1C98_0127 [Bifidobacterium sp. DSM 109960]|uniref:Secreted protein n=1 Tax=Bifidobacterium erythrocebi TaxID=2675325 RepID=A0A7Y0ES31_9BIFI|nr:hypothetical protein [Bifidobacterium sp. DSM 109960]
MVTALVTAVSLMMPLTVFAEGTGGTGSFSVPLISASWVSCEPSTECGVDDSGRALSFDTGGSSSKITAKAKYSLQISAQTGTETAGVDMPAGTLEWRIPQYLFKGRSNENVGSSAIDLPQCTTAKDTASWCYTVDAKTSEYVVTNHLPITEARSVDVTVSYIASPNDIVDKDVSKDKSYASNGTSTAHSTVTTSDGTPQEEQ